MYQSIIIKYFRGIRHMELSSLGQVNLFLGKNNCGKSSLLEAMFLLSGASNPLLNININLFREYSKVERNDLLLLFYGLNGQTPIEISAVTDTNIHTLKIEPFNEAILTSATNNSLVESASTELISSYGLKNTLLIRNGHEISKEFQLRIQPQTEDSTGYRFKIDGDKNYETGQKAKYLSPKFQFQVSVEKLKELKIEGEIQPIIEILRLVDARIVSLDYIDRDVFVDLGFGKLVPINVMGDGIRKLLGIIISLYECRNGMIFIDEIDNGFHYSLMPLLWQTVLETAKKLHVQVFASTHSIDSLRGLTTITSADKVKGMRSQVACFYLQASNTGDIKSYRYEADKFEFLINQGEEIR